MNSKKTLVLFFYTLLLTLLFLMVSCQKQMLEVDSSEKKAYVDAVIDNEFFADSLDLLLSRFVGEKNTYGVMRVYVKKAQDNHTNSKYNESLEEYRKALNAAEQLGDTLEMMDILNSMGTNLRRLGAMGEASSYFYKTLNHYGDYSGNTEIQAKKTRLIALNSIGNINKTMGNEETADSLFRVSLQGSLELGDLVGCAINSANIGLVFEQKGQLDSAWYYQHQAMEYNKRAKYNLGVAITHLNYGKLYEKQGDYDSAMREYEASMDSTKDNSNRWQWLMSSTKWIGLNIKKGNYDIVRDDLDLAEKYANEIRSTTHLSDVARLNSLYHDAKGDHRRALQYFKVHKFYSDSLRNTQSANELHSLRLQYERENNNREMLVMQQKHDNRQRNKNTWLMASIIVSLSAIIAVCILVYALRMRVRSQQVVRQIDEMRSNFFTNITHEFRTPLTVMMGMTEQLRKKGDNDVETQVIIRQGNVLLNMINQLLDMAKVKSSKEHSKWFHDDVVAYINMMIETYLDYFSLKDIDLIFISDKRSIYMDFVPEFFNKIIRNLFSNALKYTPKGGKVTLTVDSVDTDFRLIVSDTGQGIPLNDLPHIFEEFYQGDQSHTESGTGIGLAFVNKMIESMGGKIVARNLPEGGAEFSITLPLKQNFEVKDRFVYIEQSPACPFPCEKEEEEIGVVDHTDTEKKDKPSILIIEDNIDVRFYIGSLFDNIYHIRFASNGEEGISKAKNFMPDLIITDLMMPVLDGYAVCNIIRQSDILNHIPIIVITAKATDEDKQRALTAGADAYLQKPFNTDELNIRVSKLLEQRNLLRKKYSKAMIEGASEEVELSAADRQFLDRLTFVVYERIANPELNPDVVADKMCMSRSQLNRKIRNITGYSIAAYILHVRIEKAKRMLLTSETPVGEIAAQCGFEDSNYFSRVFRQIYKTSPTRFRKTSH